MNNKLSLALNVVLLAAVAVLFYLQFSSRKELADVKSKVNTDTAAPKLSFRVPKSLTGAHVLYVNIDSISLKYDAFKDLADQEGGNMEQQYQQYQIRVANYQRRYDALHKNNGNDFYQKFGADSAEKEEKFLNKEEQALMNLQNYLTNLQNKAAEKNQMITDQVVKYFKDYSKEKGIDYILGVGAGSPIMYANDSLNITDDVVEALNQNYRLNKDKPAPPAK